MSPGDLVFWREYRGEVEIRHFAKVASLVSRGRVAVEYGEGSKKTRKTFEASELTKVDGKARM